jgi:hypothetical protein
VRPDAAEGRDQFLFGGHPIWLGIDKSAVHIPQDGGRKV